MVHLEQVAVFLLNGLFSKALDGIGEVEIDGIACAHAIARIAALLGGTAGHVAWHQVAESGITAFQVVVAVFFRYVVGFQFASADGFGIFLSFGHPNATVVAEALAHQRELALVVTVHRDAGRVNLHIARVGEGRALAMAHPRRAAVAVHSIGGKIIEITVTASTQHHRVGGIAFQVAGGEVTDDDASGAAINHDQVHHFAARVQFHCASGDFATQGTVGT